LDGADLGLPQFFYLKKSTEERECLKKLAYCR